MGNIPFIKNLSDDVCDSQWSNTMHCCVTGVFEKLTSFNFFELLIPFKNDIRNPFFKTVFLEIFHRTKTFSVLFFFSFFLFFRSFFFVLFFFVFFLLAKVSFPPRTTQEEHRLPPLVLSRVAFKEIMDVDVDDIEALLDGKVCKKISNQPIFFSPLSSLFPCLCCFVLFCFVNPHEQRFSLSFSFFFSSQKNWKRREVSLLLNLALCLTPLPSSFLC